MKKLKCDSCGATLKIDENKEFAYCEYCNSKYKLKEDININVNLNNSKEILDNMGINTKFSRVFMAIFIVIFIAVFTTIIFTFVRISADNSFEKESFNGQYELVTGTTFKLFVDNVLDNISTNNKKNDRKITVVYKDKKTNKSDEIIDIKLSLTDGVYELAYEYDKDGFINKLIIKDSK